MKNELVKKAILAGTIGLASMLGLSGCVEESYHVTIRQETRGYNTSTTTTVTEDGDKINIRTVTKRNVEPKKSFFACNYWKDFNGNGVAEPEEFVGVKNRFNEDEKINVIAYNVSGNSGEDLKTKIYNPSGELIYESVDPLRNGGNAIQKKIDNTKEFAQRYGYGDYKTTFWKNGEYVGATDFEIVKNN